MATKFRVRPLLLLNLKQKVRYNIMSTFAALFILLLSPYVFKNGLVGAVIQQTAMPPSPQPTLLEHQILGRAGPWRRMDEEL
jgi:hypothetical protein